MNTALTKAQRKAIDRHNRKLARKIARFVAPQPIQHVDDRPLTAEEEAFALTVKSAVAKRAGTTDKDVHVTVFESQLLIDTAQEFLRENEPEFFARLNKHRFGS